ncbi:protein ovarian tumor locus-like isoform X2 [Leptopilina boulardi]|uniref:protein ovarian tumor locus-like isoform X2 n=1 Tax=Leptopilina boulardi TaxID=63433 RepID=UPI0021F5D92C|nr:protein ovarian tumor locus-like isoform X2 [Leptopilina boulardi]
MEGSPRKLSKRPAEPIDDWLESQGYFRKHAPKDPTCLFRAISEQIYSTQHFHIRVRRECINFMKKHKDLFKKKINVPFDGYIDQMACFTEWGGIHEIEAMSELYQREIIIFDGQTMTRKIVNNNYGYKNHITLCYTAQKQYESVYTKEYIKTAGFCQSLVYKTLYKEVFQMPNVDETVYKMLHDRPFPLKYEKFSPKGIAEHRENSAIVMLNKVNDGCTESEDIFCLKGTPFPYRVAKALDEDIFRNTDFDIWHEIRREVRNSGFSKYNGTEFQVGGKCLVEINMKVDDLTNNNDLNTTDKKIHINCDEACGNTEKFLTGHIQEMSKNEGPVVVFILELGEKRTVPYSALKPFNMKRTKANILTIPKKNPAVDPSALKIKKPFSSTRRSKEISTFERNSNKGSCNKRNVETGTMKWTAESSENKAAFVKSCVENYNPPVEDFTADLDVPVEREKNTTTTITTTTNTTSPSIANEENMKKLCLSNPVIANGSENNYQFQPPQQNVTFFIPPAENNNFQQIVPPCVNDVLPNVDFLLDQADHPINMSAAKSIDVNGSDLPLSDLQTLRFFYNLGIQYLNAANYLCSVNHPPPINGQFNNFPMENSPEQKPNNIPGSQEDVNQVTHMQPKYGFRAKKENGENGFKSTFNNNYKTLKNSNVRFNGTQEPLVPNNTQRNPKDCNKNAQYCNNERSREHINESKDVTRTPRNGVAPRFKKCIDGRNRNFVQPSRRNQQREGEFHQGNNRFPGSKIEGQGKQFERNSGSPGNRQNQYPHQVQLPMNNPQYQYAPHQPSIYPQQMCNDAETYCQQNTGLIPIPYVHSVDNGDNNANSFPPVIYTGVDNYQQTYVPYYQPYAYQPQTVYPGMGPGNSQENWYQYPGHSHYIPPCVQFNQPPPPQPGSSSNGAM